MEEGFAVTRECLASCKTPESRDPLCLQLEVRRALGEHVACGRQHWCFNQPTAMAIREGCGGHVEGQLDAGCLKRIQGEGTFWRGPLPLCRHSVSQSGELLAIAERKWLIHKNQRLARSLILSVAGDQSWTLRRRASKPAISSE